MDTSQINLEKFESVLKVATKRNNDVYLNVQRVLNSLDDIFQEKLLRGMDDDESASFVAEDEQASEEEEEVPTTLEQDETSFAELSISSSPLFSAMATAIPAQESPQPYEDDYQQQQQQQQPMEYFETRPLALPFGYRLPLLQTEPNEQVFTSYSEFWKNNDDYIQGHVVDNTMHYGYNERFQGFKVLEIRAHEFESEVDLYTDAEGELGPGEEPVPTPLQEDDDEDCFSLPVAASARRAKPSFADEALVNKRYLVVTKAGSGSFSKTFVCKDLEHEFEHLCCIKVITAEFEVAVNEISTLRRLQNAPNVVQLTNCFYLSPFPCLVFELLYDNLYEVAEKFRLEGSYFNELVLVHIASQVLDALEYAHDRGIIHADLKPENIMLTEPVSCDFLPQIKVIDWGCTKRHTPTSEVSADAEETYFQTRAYRAPEVILGCGFGAKIDTWSLGVILGELFVNHLFLNSTTSVPQLLASICSVCGPFPLWMIRTGVFAPQYFVNGFLIERFERSARDGFVEDEDSEMESWVNVLFPKPSNVADRLDSTDEVFADFITALLQVDPNFRLDVQSAKQHPVFHHS